MLNAQESQHPESITTFVDAYLLGRKFHIKTDIPSNDIKSVDGSWQFADHSNKIRDLLFEKIKAEIWSEMIVNYRLEYSKPDTNVPDSAVDISSTQSSVSICMHWDPTNDAVNKGDYLEYFELVSPKATSECCSEESDSSNILTDKMNGYVDVSLLMHENDHELDKPIDQILLNSNIHCFEPSQHNKSLILLDIIRKANQSIFTANGGMYNDTIGLEFQELLRSILYLTGSEYGFIGEVVEEEKDGEKIRFLKTQALTDILPETHKKFPKYDYNVGMEFRQLKSLWGYVVTTSKAVISNDPSSDPRSSGIPPWHPPMDCFVGIPLFYDQSLVGMVGLANKSGGYCVKDIEFLIPFLNSTAHFIETHRVQTMRQQAEDRLRKEVIEKTLLAQKLEYARDQAEMATRAKSQFLACMSHEIRTPLHGILGVIDLLMETSKSKEQEELTKTMKKCGENLMILVDDILDLSKIEAGTVAINHESVRLQELVEGTLQVTSMRWNDRGDNFFYHYYLPGIPESVVTDGIRLRQILYNLTGNAAKFSPNGGCVFCKVFKLTSTDELIEQLSSEKILKLDSELMFLDYLKENKDEFTSKFCTKTAEKTSILFTIADQGIGIDQESISRLFNVFVQGDTTLTRKFEGSGLGLAICKSLCKLMGGDIAVVSKPGVGSVFYFTIKVEEIGGAYQLLPASCNRALEALKSKTTFLMYQQHFSTRFCRMHLEDLGQQVYSFAFNQDPSDHAFASKIALSDDQIVQNFENLMKKLQQAGAKIDCTFVQLTKTDLAGKSLMCRLLRIFRKHNSEFGSSIFPYGIFAVRDFIDLVPGIKECDAKLISQYTLNQLKMDNNFNIISSALERKESVDFTLGLIPSKGKSLTRFSTGIETFEPELLQERRVKVLVAEDNLVNQTLLARMFSKLGIATCDIQIVDNGKKALEAVLNGDFQLVLMDLHMPEMDGIEATRLIRQGNCRSQPLIVALTANALDETREKCLESGFDDFLTKPLGLHTLKSKFCEWKILN